MSSSSIGFVGLGAMGWPMASRLLPAYPLCVIDIDAARAASFSEQIGGKRARSLAELAAASDIVITMLPTSREVDAVLTGATGVLAHCRKNTLIIEMSSGAPAQTKLFASRAAEADCSLIDAPVSGGVPRARTGELAVMVGGDARDIRRAEPVLKLMGSTVLETGPVGSGHAMKALNNLVSASTLLATIEAVRVGERAGLDPGRVVDILNVSTGMSNSSLKKMHQFVLSRKFDSGFGLDLLVKDLNNAKAIGSEYGLSAPLSDRCIEVWEEAAATLGRGQDHTAMVKALELKDASLPPL
ncbi:NAD(P)-dependent oxidoreductase [Bradyrhizobium sp. CCBAU 51627]|uniref:NAD(P)-dependent oxidoreductase n=1 Tax=Bradyrhizobium sp. CCBAU 51627 TaxID=1325088 RepID=UPI0023067226|nr:NAD(P)-dependent oxidoreductase [Bradyrhizobium sp. CCBAU 51627]MDA9433862.1 hydroxyacid oxidoreductase [Bradyrhizobium sp. CCBAU 51627]